MIKPRSVDRFEIKVNINEPKGNECVIGAQVKGIVNIYYEQSGQVSSEGLKFWLHIKNESGMNSRKGVLRDTYNKRLNQIAAKNAATG